MINPEKVKSVRIAACDLNGQMRGKRLPRFEKKKFKDGSIRMPLSALNVDIFGADIENSPLVFETGDQDGLLKVTSRGVIPVPWLKNPTALVPVSMFTEDEEPFEGDPRYALKRIIKSYESRGLRPIAATEMEFYLIDERKTSLLPPINPISGKRLSTPDVMGISELDCFDDFFSDLQNGCEQIGITVQSITSESGCGQFEVTLKHCDALTASDDAWLFKILTKGLARKHGIAATFMAKPYSTDAGNGMHIHFSIMDQNGQNIFNNNKSDGSEFLKSAVAGCLHNLRGSTLIFAPFGNSYKRFVKNAHAPISAQWGYENRTTAIRIPGGDLISKRIEHRVAGGDTNPYLVMTAVLGSALLGIEKKLTPTKPVMNNAYSNSAEKLANNWEDAVNYFGNDKGIKQIFSKQLIDNLIRTKRQELSEFKKIESSKHWKYYVAAI